MPKATKATAVPEVGAPEVFDGTSTSMFRLVQIAVGATEASESRWAPAIPAVRAIYVTPEGLEAARADFCANAIIPKLPKADREALATKLPRKGSEEAKAMPDWQDRIDALASARGKVASYFSRVMKRAFPKAAEPVEATNTNEANDDAPDGKVASGITAARLAERIATMVKQVQAADGLDGVDVPEVIKGLSVALAAIKI